MKKIIMKTISAGPDGCWQPGQKRECDEKTAKSLVDGGYAEYAVDIEAEAKAQSEQEAAEKSDAPDTTDAESAPETAEQADAPETAEPVKPKKSKSKK